MPFNGTTPEWLANKTAIENGLYQTPQLFDLNKNLKEKINLAQMYPETLNRLQQRINQLKARKTQ